MKSSRFISRIKGSPLDTAAVVIMFLGSVLSFMATYNGLYDFLNASGSESSTTRWLAIGLTVFIQAMIILTAVRVRRSNLFIKPIWFSLYVFAAFFSIAFASSFWISALEGDRLALASAEGPFITTRNDLISYGYSYDNFNTVLTDLVVHCRESAIREDKSGNSCGYFAGEGEGPRYDLRIADSTTLSRFGRDMGKHGMILESYLSRLNTLEEEFDPRESRRTEKKLRNLLVDATHSRENPTIRQLRMYLNERIASGGRDLEMSGEVFDCVDPQFERLAHIILREIETLPVPPDPSSITFYEGKNSSDAVRIVFDECLGAMASVISLFKPMNKAGMIQERAEQIKKGKDAGTSGPLEAISTMPIAMGVIVDFFIFVAALMTSRGGWLLRGGRSFIERMDEEIHQEYSGDEQVKKVRDLIIDDALVGVSLYDVVTLALDDSYRTVALANGTKSLQMALLRFMDLLCETGDARSCDPNSRLIRKHLERKGANGMDLPPYAWELEPKVSPSRIRIVVMIMENYLRVSKGSEEKFGCMSSAQMRLF